MKVLFVTLLLLLSTPTLAQQPNVATHNGSLVTVARVGASQLDIRYLRPRVGLIEVGVVPGTLLVRGHWVGPPPQVLEATAFVFAPGCAPIPYPVTGGVDPSGALVLRGPAPVVLPWCIVVGVAWTDNSELRFVPAHQQ